MEEMQVTRMPLIGDKAPSFQAVTTQGEIHFPEDYTCNPRELAPRRRCDRTDGRLLRNS